eukprot:412310-Rhodomonas_salina.2
MAEDAKAMQDKVFTERGRFAGNEFDLQQKLAEQSDRLQEAMTEKAELEIQLVVFAEQRDAALSDLER